MTLTKSLNKYCPSGKILGAFLNRSLASSGINFSASVNIVEHISRLRTPLQISLIKIEVNREQTLSISALYVNNFMQISVDIQGAHRDKALRDDPNESFPVFYY